MSIFNRKTSGYPLTQKCSIFLKIILFHDKSFSIKDSHVIHIITWTNYDIVKLFN